MGRYWRPQHLAEALNILGEAAPVVLAGGTWLARDGGLPGPDAALLDISAVAELQGIAQQDGRWRIGAATTWSTLLQAKVPPFLAGLRQAGAMLGSPQIRRQGTIGGNLLARFPAADGVPALLCLDASLEFASVAGARRVPLQAMLAGAMPRQDELLTAILLPAPAGGQRSDFLKHGYRRAMAVAVASAAIRLDIAGGTVRGARIALGGCLSLPQRLPGLEAALFGQPVQALAASIGPEALTGLPFLEDGLAPAAYRQSAALVLLRRLLAQAEQAA
ncbi:FAD binding domain-containing protein [Siccirubricoccus phaeus]|uniref:FAD binding domain-containing protein n=1 Tax=Siccirubricoccus phaeus TaxID=2595053 RepID=UPI0011F2A1F7|nr:FAD binding domain-containing protein [Siccirubricoccus phaeus]